MAIQCKVCDSENTIPEAIIGQRQRYQCQDCKTLFYQEEETVITAAQQAAFDYDAGKQVPIIEAYKRGDKIENIKKNFPGFDLYPLLRKCKIPLRENNPEHPASSMQTRQLAEALDQEFREDPNCYKCKKCDFKTPGRTATDKANLIGHYSSVHSWHKEEREGLRPVPGGQMVKTPELKETPKVALIDTKAEEGAKKAQKKANRADNLSDDQRIDILWCLMKNYQTTPDLAKKILDLVRILDGF